jgi:hypothetical protein
MILHRKSKALARTMDIARSCDLSMQRGVAKSPAQTLIWDAAQVGTRLA